MAEERSSDRLAAARSERLTSGLTSGLTKPAGPLDGKSRAEARDLVARTGYDVATGRAPRAKYQELSKAFAEKFPDTAPPSQRLERKAAADRSGRSAARGAHTGANSVRVEHVGQQRDWWCGPATAYMIIGQLARDGKIDSTRSANGERLSQQTLAGRSYLKSNGGGGTYRTDLKRTLNRWTGKNLYDIKSNPTPVEFAGSLMQSIDSGQAIGVATLEPAGQVHYNGHPYGSTIDHWIVASGYSKKGSVTHFADPATTIWSSTKRYFSADTEEFVERYVEPSKAIIW